MDPGCLPRIVTEEESLFLIQVIDKIILIAQYFMANNLPLSEFVNIDEMYSFKVGKEVTHKIIDYPILKIKNNKTNLLKDELINKALFLPKENRMISISLMYTPFYVEETLSYPKIITLFDLKTNKILNMEIIKPCDEMDIPNIILKKLIELKCIPKKIIFADSTIEEYSKEIIKELKITTDIEFSSELYYMWEQLNYMM